MTRLRWEANRICVTNLQTEIISSQPATKQGFSESKQSTVFNAIIMFRLVYVASAWRGYSWTVEYNYIQAFLIKVNRWNIITEGINFDDIMDDHDLIYLRKHNSKSTISTSSCQQFAIADMLEKWKIGEIHLTYSTIILK